MVEITCVTNIRDIFKTYKSIIKRWFRRGNKRSLSVSEDSPQCLHQIQQESVENEEGTDEIHGFRLNGVGLRKNSMNSSGCNLYRNRSLDGSCFHSMNSVCTNGNRKIENNHDPRRSSDFMATPSWNRRSSFGMHPHLQSRNVSRRSNATIMFSNSSGMLKPLPIEKKLECTLEELCYGCTKKIMIQRDVLTDTGGIVQEEELLGINIQPGWKKGTKITFEGKGNERPGAYREDIIFFISEKRHHLFRREGDDLELSIEIPLLKALTGCTILVPLLGGEEMSLALDDIIHPGYEKIIPGQGMPTSREPGQRGNLRIKFLVEFPTQLTDSQRSEVLHILQDSC